MTDPSKLKRLRVARTETMLTLIGVPDVPGIAAAVFKALAENHIALTMIVQNAPDAGSAASPSPFDGRMETRRMTLPEPSPRSWAPRAS